MHFTLPTIATLIFAGLSAAAPANDRRQFEAQLTFTGAAGAGYAISAPTDGSKFFIDDEFKFLSVSQITSLGGASCTLFGSEGSITTLVGASTVGVGPPQPQVLGSCLAL